MSETTVAPVAPDMFGRYSRWEYACDCGGWTRVYRDPEGVWEECDCSGGYVDTTAPADHMLAGVVEVHRTGSYWIQTGRASTASGDIPADDMWPDALDRVLGSHSLTRGPWSRTEEGWRAYVFTRDWSRCPA